MLYFVATPIGNLDDMTLRAIETLKNVDVIACEDTRNSLKLLLHFDIKKQLIAYHKNNEKSSAKGIINLLKQNKNVAVISDSGMPVISDPGNILVKELQQNNLEYTVIPGANAALCALLLSGFDAKCFTFVGFLPEKNKDRIQILNNVKGINSTLIFYISPHNLQEDIACIANVLGKRNACLVKEITKIHENITLFTLGEEISSDKGEHVLIVEGKTFNEKIFDTSIEEHIEQLISQGTSKNDAIKIVAKERKLPKSEVYKLTIK